MLSHGAPRNTSNHIHMECLPAWIKTGFLWESLSHFSAAWRAAWRQGQFSQYRCFPQWYSKQEQDQDSVVMFWVPSYAAPHIECSSFHLSLYVFKYTHFSPSLLTDAHICLMSLNTRALPAALTAWFPWLWNALSSCFSQTLDYETKKSYSLKVEAANVHIDPKFISNGPFKDTVTVKIAVEDADEPPVFLKPSYIFEVQENAASGTVVGKVHAKDPDAANSAIRFAAFPASFWALASGISRCVLKTLQQIYRHPEYWNFNYPALFLCLCSISCQFIKAWTMV